MEPVSSHEMPGWGPGPVSAVPAALAGLNLSGVGDLAGRLGYVLPFAGVGQSRKRAPRSHP